MPRSYRRSETGRWTRQHHGCPSFRRLAFVVVLSVLAIPPVYSQTLLRIQTIEGEGIVNAAGSRSQRPVAVQLTDETGRPLEGIAVSFRLPEEGPSGAFESGMKTEIVITAADGRAAVHGIRWNSMPGPFQIRITAAKGESRAGTICSQYISTAPASKSTQSVRGRNKKWLTIAAIAAGGAAAGLAVGRGSGQQQPSTVPTTPTQPTTIGLPTISIARP